MYSFVDRDMFMRYRGGAVGHKTTQEETKCLLGDRDKLDKVPFELECNQDWYANEGSDVEMSGGDDGENVMEDEHEEGGGSDIEVDHSEGGDGEENEIDSDESESGDMAGDPSSGLSASLADDELLDEMEEFGYTGLDQVVQEEEELDYLGEDDLGAEDGENDERDDLEPVAYL